MRSSDVPARTASTTVRTAARTSSSASDAVMMRVEDADNHRRERRPQRWPAEVHPEAGDGLDDLGIGLGHPGGAGEDAQLAGGAERGQQLGRVAGEPLGEVDDHGADVGGDGAAQHGGGGRCDEVLFVVPALGQAGPCRPVDAHHLARSGAAGGKGGERHRIEVAQLPVGGHERGLGGGVGGHRSERARLFGQRLSDRGAEHRHRDRPPVLGRQGGGAEQLGQPVRRDERDADEPGPGTAHRSHHARREQAPRGHPDLVGRHHDRDRGEGARLP